MSGVEPTVDQRDDREKVFGIVFLHRAVDARRVSRRIAEHPKSAANEVCEPSLLAPLALILEIVDRQHRRVTGKCSVEESISVVGQARTVTDLIGDALHGL